MCISFTIVTVYLEWIMIVDYKTKIMLYIYYWELRLLKIIIIVLNNFYFKLKLSYTEYTASLKDIVEHIQNPSSS